MPSAVVAAAIAGTTVSVGMAGTLYVGFSFGAAMSAFASSVVVSGLSSDLPAGGA